MVNKSVARTRNGMLLSYKEKRNHNICREIDGTGNYYVKQCIRTQRPHVLSHVEPRFKTVCVHAHACMQDIKKKGGTPEDSGEIFW